MDNEIASEKKVYLCNDCDQAYDGEKYGKWVETYMSNLMVWVCLNCLEATEHEQATERFH